jgi:ARC6-like, IMS domain
MRLGILALIFTSQIFAIPVNAKIISPLTTLVNPETPNNLIAQGSATNSAITMGQATDIITRWLEAKGKIFSPPFDKKILANFTTGELYIDTLRAINLLKKNDGYYRYGVQKVEGVERFASSLNKATIEVKVTEEVTYYQNGKVDNSSFNTKLVRYSLEYEEGLWKIAESQVLP